tara:strand:+ start:14097 stop:14498 length:402 start_codon:yes stop_codon:yes gene_type:complete
MMSSLIRSLFTAFFTLATLAPLAITPVYALGTVEDYLACPMSDQIRNKEAAIAWWNRRSELEQRLVLSVPCVERFAPIICIFLYNPDLKGCTEKGLAEYRANKSCQDRGMDLLSQQMSDCKEEFKRNYKPPTS